MNKERILKLANHIETCHYSPDGPKDKQNNKHFNMDTWVFTCGSPACMAGHTLSLFGTKHKKTESNRNILQEAAYLLGLDLDAANKLFSPEEYNIENGHEDMYPYHDMDEEDVIADLAAACLRHLAESNYVDWQQARWNLGK